MTYRFATCAAALVLGLVSTAPQLDAQEPTGNPATVTAPEPRPVTLSYEFRGGPVTSYFAGLKAALQQQNPNATLNIVRPDDAVDFPMPHVELTDVTLDTAVNVVEYLAPRDVLVDVKTIRDRGSEPLWVVRSMPAERPMAMQTGTVFATFSLRELAMHPHGIPATCEGVTVPPETVLNAIRLAIGMFEGRDKPEVLFHDDSKLLFVRGTPEQRQLVAEVIDRLEMDVRSRRRQILTTEHAAPPAPAPEPPAPAAPTEPPVRRR